jgi:predicted AAA+ superfamily ATPase
MIQRIIKQSIKNKLKDNKAIIILGARQVGKTTLINSLFENQKSIMYWNGDETDIREWLEKPTSTKLKNLIGKSKILIIDEAQRIKNIGICIKLILENIPSVKVIATGSSSFDLSNKINEPLTGRKWEFYLYPISFEEMVNHHGLINEKRLLEQRLIFGYYPEIILNPESAAERIKLIADSYLYKDILMWENIKKPEKLEKLVKALALQIGSEVSYNELSEICGLDNETIERYIQLLEKAFILYRLEPYSNNIRNELKKKRKIYFYDNGIRNAVLNDFSPLDSRKDKGALFENFVITERLKYLTYHNKKWNRFFWRNTNQQEVDYIEINNKHLYAYEIKFSDKSKVKIPNIFKETYQPESIQIINNSNYFDLIS